MLPYTSREYTRHLLEQLNVPSISKLEARYCKAITPGSLGMNTGMALRVLVCATEETPMYITRALMRDKL